MPRLASLDMNLLLVAKHYQDSPKLAGMLAIAARASEPATAPPEAPGNAWVGTWVGSLQGSESTRFGIMYCRPAHI